MRPLQLVFRYTLNNVIFGIALLAAALLYIAIGSGLPSVRAYFEMNDLEFFSAWPLKLLMVLLCSTLAVVTWNRIPLTPPRYGVWCIHAGIITLIVGMSLYYHLKVEGKTLMPIGHTVNYFYDSAERALYVRVMDRSLYGMHPLPSLPRFAASDADRGERNLRRADLVGIDHFLPVGPEPGLGDDLSSVLGIADKVHFDVVGFYPYADVVQNVVEDPASNNVGVELKVAAPHVDAAESTLVLTSADPTTARQVLGNTELEHRHVSESSLAMIREAAGQMLQFSVKLPNQAAQYIPVQVGKTYAMKGGYQLTVDSFNPAFPMFGTHETVRALTVHVVSDTPAVKREFWRMVLEGKSVQTDFKMDPATTPPMVKGNRQKEPIDKDLAMAFRFDDPAALMPVSGTDKLTFLTAGDHSLVAVHASLGEALEMKDFSDGGGDIQLSFDGTTTTAHLRRMNHFAVQSRVIETAPAKQVKDEAEAGVKQVALVRVTAGKWSQQFAVPCDLYPLPDPMLMEPMSPWSMGLVRIPGASAALQLQLGYVCRPMPALLTLRSFEMVHYPGGQGDSGPFRDFRSTLEITPPGGERDVAVTSLNSPVYFDGGRWIFFQAGYDPEGHASTIGVGNRPGVTVMIAGCVMIVLGLMYAFYVKPIVIRRMKAAALAKAAARAAMPAKESLVSSNTSFS